MKEEFLRLHQVPTLNTRKFVIIQFYIKDEETRRQDVEINLFHDIKITQFGKQFWEADKKKKEKKTYMAKFKILFDIKTK